MYVYDEGIVMDQYEEAHIFVAAIRVLEYQKKGPPTIEDVCGLLSFSKEAGHEICRRLKEKGILRSVEGAFGMKLFLEDHLQLEEIPRGEKKQNFANDLAEFQRKQQDKNKKIESIQDELAKKKSSMFAELEEKLKEQLKKK